MKTPRLVDCSDSGVFRWRLAFGFPKAKSTQTFTALLLLAFIRSPTPTTFGSGSLVSQHVLEKWEAKTPFSLW